MSFSSVGSAARAAAIVNTDTNTADLAALPQLEELPLGGSVVRRGHAEPPEQHDVEVVGAELHQEGGVGDEETLADIGELRLEKALAGLHPDGSRDWAQQVIQAMKLRAGLLLEREPGLYSFPHRTFQEYLAGSYLSGQADFAYRASGLVEESALWREVILLGVGRLVYVHGDSAKPLTLVGELCPAKESDDAASWRKAWLAGDVLLEIGLNRVQDSNLGRDLLNRVRRRMDIILIMQMHIFTGAES